MDLQEVGWGGKDWLYLARDTDRWQALVNEVWNFVFHKMRDFLTSWDLWTSQEGLCSMESGVRSTRWILGWVVPELVWTLWRDKTSASARNINSGSPVVQPAALPELVWTLRRRQNLCFCQEYKFPVSTRAARNPVTVLIYRGSVCTFFFQWRGNKIKYCENTRPCSIYAVSACIEQKFALPTVPGCLF
jgi:hypothetical protein